MDIYLVSQLINGLIFGLLYGLIALGLTIVFSIMRVVNFAHGELYMLGGYMLYLLTVQFGLPPLLGLPLCMIVVGLVGCLIERVLLRPVYTTRMERAEEYAIILTFGLSLLLQNGALWGIGPYELTPASFWEGSKHIIGDLYLAGDRLYAAGVAAILLIATLLLVYRTWWGHALMATAQSRVGASIVGINAIRMHLLAMGLSGLLAAAAGALIAPIFFWSIRMWGRCPRLNPLWSSCSAAWGRFRAVSSARCFWAWWRASARSIWRSLTGMCTPFSCSSWCS